MSSRQVSLSEIPHLFMLGGESYRLSQKTEQLANLGGPILLAKTGSKLVAIDTGMRENLQHIVFIDIMCGCSVMTRDTR